MKSTPKPLCMWSQCRGICVSSPPNPVTFSEKGTMCCRRVSCVYIQKEMKTYSGMHTFHGWRNLEERKKLRMLSLMSNLSLYGLASDRAWTLAPESFALLSSYMLKTLPNSRLGASSNSDCYRIRKLHHCPHAFCA